MVRLDVRCGVTVCFKASSCFLSDVTQLIQLQDRVFTGRNAHDHVTDLVIEVLRALNLKALDRFDIASRVGTCTHSMAWRQRDISRSGHMVIRATEQRIRFVHSWIFSEGSRRPYAGRSPGIPRESAAS